MQETLEDYGLRCEKFVVAAIDIDDDELRRRYDEIGMNAIAKMRGAQADKAVMDVLGDDWGKQQAVNILADLANNPSTGGVAAAGAGMGMGIGVGSTFGSMAQQIFIPMTDSFVQPHQPPIQSKFFENFTQQSATNTQAQASTEDPMKVLEKLKKLLDAGLIEPAEYDAKKAELLSRL